MPPFMFSPIIVPAAPCRKRIILLRVVFFSEKCGRIGTGVETLEQTEDLLILDIEKDPYNYVRQTVFSRWKPFILQALDTDQVTGFARFCKQLPITQKVLTQNLKALEKDGLIQRTVIPETPPRTEYRLTERGRSLIPLLDAVYDWGWRVMQEEHLPVDALGEMWHGYRERQDELMHHPFHRNKPLKS